jgi:hypothetical protein
MNFYNIAYLNSVGIKKRASMTGFSVQDVRTAFNSMVRIDNNQYFDCKLLRVWQNKPSSPKQILAQRYGFIMGGIKGARSSFISCYPNLQAGRTDAKVTNGISLVNAQFSKLQRDISDVFKLAGLKIK